MARITKKLNLPPEPEPQSEPEATRANIFTTVSEPQIEQIQQSQQQQEASPFDSMLDSEYNHILDQQINKALAKIQERFGRMMVQERGLGDKPKDRLGYNTDDYENMVKQIRAQAANESSGYNREEIYQKLYDLKFTEMRRLDLIKQEFNRGNRLT